MSEQENSPSFEIELVDNWYHPLSEFDEIDGQEIMNSWAVASNVCGVATQRRKEGCQTTAVEMLIIEELINAETWEDEIKVFYEDDAKYLNLINNFHEILENENGGCLGDPIQD
jgi:hypothetical protein